jgi:hypothetical protein
MGSLARKQEDFGNDQRKDEEMKTLGELAIWTVAVALAMAGVYIATAMAMGEVPRMTKEELKGQLSNPDVVIIDVRSGKDWKASEIKIKGAVREDPTESESWIDKYPKDKTLILYCA